MRVLLVGMGSRGDVQPLLALAPRLEQLGYAVSLAAAADFRPLVEGHGVRFEPLSFDLEGPLRTGLGREGLQGSATTQVREARLMRQVVAQTAEALAADLERLVARADAVVSGALTFDAVHALLSVDGRSAKPHVYAVFAPVWPSAHGPSVALALRPHAESRLNLAWSMLAGRVALDLFRPPGDLIRRRRGLPRNTFRGYVAAARSTPTLLGASPSIVPPAPDWPPALRQTGYWVDAVGNPRADDRGDLEPQLERFLAAGPPPVYVGFGSMPTPDPVGVARDVAGVLRRLSARGVLSEGLAGLAVPRGSGDGASGGPQVIGVGATSHEALFPRCAAVVHHGGAGTTAAALRAGVPQVVVPHAADQPYWGRRMADLGVAAEPIARKDLTPARLERALDVALSRGAREAAYRLGEQVRAEDGAGEAARLIHAHIKGR
ncbi:glycosyltransferase [Humibacillus xanthopallidus]|uniref:UDP:flavonoid glycosyltransferase YjiC (YdhE family) n=1 Tax=Humibacillus xanthopallidus TaxID=412689 RepID=A0A543HGE1_9MICO|nr:glycosyltransferase [Humibacillus xanthopallidus]TQM57399.1 UDP:flavonoid glycosyltransferase YjiC (YdhE family) [Humibacillus xanthopallidus]